MSRIATSENKLLKFSSGDFVEISGELVKFPVFWYKSDYGITKDSLNNISSWLDFSGNMNTLIQGTAINQPILQNNVINGFPSVYFAGNNWIETLFVNPKNQPNTIFVVCNKPSAGDHPIYDAPSGFRNHLYYAAGRICIYAGITIGYNRLATFGHTVFAAVHNTTNSLLYENAVLKLQGNNGSEPMSGLRIGANVVPNRFWTGYITEVIGYNEHLSLYHIESITSYLTSKYGL